MRTKTGETRKIAWRNAALRDAEGTITAVLRSGEDVTARREAEAQVTFLAYHDRLTGLPNRALLEEQLDARPDARPPLRRPRRAPLLRPRQLQARQRLVRPHRRRRGAARDRAARVRADAHRRRARAPGRRRVPAAAGCGPSPRRGRRRDRPARDRADRRRPHRRRAASARSRSPARRSYVGASIGVALFPEHADDAGVALQGRRRGDVPGQARRRRDCRLLRAARERRAPAALAHRRACAARSTRASCASTTSRSCASPTARSTRWRRWCAGRTRRRG